MSIHQSKVDWWINVGEDAIFQSSKAKLRFPTQIWINIVKNSTKGK